MRQVFISYARDDRREVEALAERLRRLVDSVWFDSQLHGGEDWWAGILERIRACDIFLAVVSPASLDSEACRIERQYAASVNRTVVPVALGDLPPALPSDIATLQIVDFSTPGEESLSDLARALLAAPDPDRLPDPLPADPQPPLSYLTDLVDLVTSPRELTKSEQMEIVLQLEHGLGSSDQDEREGARQVLQSMKNRDDLATSVDKTIDLLARDQVPLVPPASPEDRAHERSPTPEQTRQPTAQASRPESSALGETERPAHSEPPDGASHAPPASKRRAILLGIATVALVAIVGLTWAFAGRNDTGEVETGPTATATPTTTSENGEKDEDGENGNVTVPPRNPCANPPSSFPGEVAWGEASDEALAWQKLFVDVGRFNNDPINCDGSYDGDIQRQVVIDLRRELNLEPANGLLDERLYRCLVHGDCPTPEPSCTPVRLPNVEGLEVGEATAVLTQAGFDVLPMEEPTEAVRPGTVLDQSPDAGTEPCEGTQVTISVAVSPSTPEPTREIE